MRYASLIGCLALCGVMGCAGATANFGFGPYPSSGIGSGLTAGVAAFIPGTVPQEGEFALVIINTDNNAAYTVNVTPQGDLAVTRTIAPCSLANFAVSCDAQLITIELVVAGSATMPTLVLTPQTGTCTQQVVYIEVPVDTSGGTGSGTGGGTDTTTDPPSLTQTLPASAVNCGFGGSTGGMAN